MQHFICNVLHFDLQTGTIEATDTRTLVAASGVFCLMLAVLSVLCCWKHKQMTRCFSFSKSHQKQHVRCTVYTKVCICRIKKLIYPFISKSTSFVYSPSVSIFNFHLTLTSPTLSNQFLLYPTIQCQHLTHPSSILSFDPHIFFSYCFPAFSVLLFHFLSTLALSNSSFLLDCTNF